MLLLGSAAAGFQNVVSHLVMRNFQISDTLIMFILQNKSKLAPRE